MNKYEELASEMIEKVSNIIEVAYKIKPKCITDDKSIKHPALINGTIYYDLECEIADDLKEFMKKVRKNVQL